jgi:hypothetical protein
VKAADIMLSSREPALEALREELDAVRRAAGIQKLVQDAPIEEASENTRTTAADAEVERLRMAVESAAAVLRAIVPPPHESDIVSSEGSSTRVRARSEGSARESQDCTLRSALCRTPRQDRPKRKVSFGGQPEEEPARVVLTDSEEEDSHRKLALTPPRKLRDSIGLTKERSSDVDSYDEKPSKTQGQPNAANVPASKPVWKVHLMWLLCSATMAVIGIGSSSVAFRDAAGPSPPVSPDMATSFGDPTCWTEGFSPQLCCLGFGTKGNPDCWDASHTFERCCLGRSIAQESFET